MTLLMNRCRKRIHPKLTDDGHHQSRSVPHSSKFVQSIGRGNFCSFHPLKVKTTLTRWKKTKRREDANRTGEKAKRKLEISMKLTFLSKKVRRKTENKIGEIKEYCTLFHSRKVK